MGMFVFRKLAESLPVLFIIVTATFFLTRLAPGGPFDSDKAFSEEVTRQLKAHYNLDAPLYRQYFDYLGGLVQGELGPSLRKPNRTVAEWISLRMPVSVQLGGCALIFAIVFGLVAGMYASTLPNSVRDYATMGFAMGGICIPSFVLGPLLVLVFSLWLGLLPVAGWERPADMILPSITLGAAYAAYIARLTRGGMLESLNQDYVRTARAKGLSEFRVVTVHALRSAVLPVVAFLGPAAAGLLTGSFVVETVFQIPGLGREFVLAAFARDYTMIMGTVLVYAVILVLLNLLSDLALAWLDPRLRD
jgi:oligopeptide transport system permease protein